MKLVLAGGTGQLGQVLARGLRPRGHEVVVLSRRRSGAPEVVHWDGRGLGPWADVVVNLAGRSVNCRYTQASLRQMMASRVDSTRAMGRAIEAASRPPRAWLQMSTATVYAHRFDAPNDEATGRIGGDEPGVPRHWRASIAIAQAWERAQAEADTPATRKVALRSAMVMSLDRGGPFDMLYRLTRCGLGGPVAGGRQFMSWVHDRDFVRVEEFLLERDDLAGSVNVASPGPLPQRDFMATLRRATGTPVGLPATSWMAEVGAFLLRAETELIFKSRRVVPGRLLDAGFRFKFPDWAVAASDLVARHCHER